MMKNFLSHNRSFTLVELIIAALLVGVVIFGINSVLIFSHYHVISSDRRAKLQNELSLCLQHITKQGLRTIGNEKAYTSPANSAVLAVESGPGANASLAFFIDANLDGRRDTGDDYWIRYNYTFVNKRFSYCANCGNSSACGSCTEEILSERVTNFFPTKITDFTNGNHVEVEITGCWDPNTLATYNTPDNPCLTMATTVQLPSISTN